MVTQTVECIEMEVEMPKSYVTRLRCKRCEYKWVPRIPSPAVCPKCHSPYWNKSATRKTGVRRNKR